MSLMKCYNHNEGAIDNIPKPALSKKSQHSSAKTKRSLILDVYRALAAGRGSLCDGHLRVQFSYKTMASSMQGALLPGYMNTISDVPSKNIQK